MAEQPVKGNEIIVDNALDNILKQLDLLNIKLKESENGFKANLSVTKEYLNSTKIDSSKAIKDNAEATKQATDNLIALEKVQQESIKAEKLRVQILQEAEKLERERIKTSQQHSKAEQQYNKEIDNTKKALAKQTKEQRDANSEYAQASKELSKLKRQLQDLVIAEKTNTNEFKNLNKQFEELDKKVRKADESVGNFQRNVGNYPKELKAIQRELQGLEPGTKQFNELAKKAGELKDKINDAKDATKAFATESKASSAKTLFGQVLDDVKNLDFKGAAEKAKTFASVVGSISFKEASAGIKSFGSALFDVGKALLTNPFTLIAASIASLIYVTYDLATAFRKFGEQAQATNEYLRETNERIKKLAELQLDYLLKYEVAIGKITKLQADAIRLDKRYSNERLSASKEFAKKSVELANELGINLDKSERGRFIDAARKQGYAQIKEKARREAYNRELLKLENKFKDEILAITKTKLAEEQAVNAEAEAARKKDLEEKAKQRAKEFRDNTKNLNDELRKLQIEDTYSSEQQQTEKVIFENKKEVERIKNTVANAETKNRFLIELEFKLQKDLREIREKFAQERADKEKKESELKLAEEKKLDDQIIKSGEASAKAAQERLDTANAQEAKKSADRKKKQEENLKETIEFEKQLLDAVAKAEAEKSQIRQDSFDKQIAETDKNIETQRRLAEKGAQNTLAEEEANKVKLQRQKEEEKQQEIKRQKALAFFKLFASYAEKDPDSALQKALRDTVLAEAVSAAFIEGTENVGKDKQFSKNKFSNGTDGYVARFDGDERILNPEQNKKVGNLSNEALADLAYKSRMGLLDTAKHAIVVSNDFSKNIADSALLQQNAQLIKELQEVKQAINDKPVPHFAMNQYHEFVLTTIENGFIKNRTFKNRKSRIC